MLIEPLNVEDATAVDRVVAFYALTDAADCPWRNGLTASMLRVASTHGWDDQPDEYFLGIENDEIVAAGSVTLPQRDNRHAAALGATVRPDRRRRGLGSELYDHLEGLARHAGRTLLFTGGPDSAATHSFATARGYHLASTGLARRVDVRDVSAEQVKDAYEEAAALAADYELLRIPGPMPDDLLEAYLAAVAAINDAPLDELALEDEAHDADRLRYYEKGQWLLHGRMYRVLARHRDTGDIAGHTVVVVEGDRPHFAEQHDTAVAGKHRGHRLGLFLKADMMRWLRDTEPDLRTITTYNAESNAHMIAVNERLDYRVAGRIVQFQRSL